MRNPRAENTDAVVESVKRTAPAETDSVRTTELRASDFHFDLPPELIAQHPSAQRDESRLLVLHRATNQIEHRRFPGLPGYLRPGDVLVLNNSRVIPARLRGTNAQSGGQFELLLLEENGVNDWWAMLRPGKRARPGTVITLAGSRDPRHAIQATVTGVNPDGHRRLAFTGTPDIVNNLDELGEVPLPPYIRRTAAMRSPPPEIGSPDRERYQTVYAQPPGSVAAPTAGLHFTEPLLELIRSRGIEICFVTLHVGYGTFAPVKCGALSEHMMHEERFEISDSTARAINAAKSQNRRVIAVGTTTVRVLESAAARAANLSATRGRTRIFIYPPHTFWIVDALLTNFHLPESTLLMLVSAFAAPGGLRGREFVLAAYAEAVRERYRFFSYGDAMLLL